MNEKDSARFFSSNLSVPTSPLTTTLRTDSRAGDLRQFVARASSIPWYEATHRSRTNVVANYRARLPVIWRDQAPALHISVHLVGSEPNPNIQDRLHCVGARVLSHGQETVVLDAVELYGSYPDVAC